MTSPNTPLELLREAREYVAATHMHYRVISSQEFLQEPCGRCSLRERIDTALTPPSAPAQDEAGRLKTHAQEGIKVLEDLIYADKPDRKAIHGAINYYLPEFKRLLSARSATRESVLEEALTFDEFRRANVARCVKWHPAGIASWSPSDWLTAVTGELGELASLLKMRNRERDGLPGNKFSPTDKQIADELADVLTYLDLLAEVLGVDLGRAAVEKFNEVSERVGFPDRIRALKGTNDIRERK